MIGHIEVGFVERERFDERGKAKQDLANDGGFFAVNVEARRENDQVRAALQRHECGHGGMHPEFAGLIVAGGQHAAPIPRATHADRFAFQ